MAFRVLLLEPAKQFIRDLRPKMKAKTFRTIDLLTQFGPTLSMPHTRKLIGHDLWELRIKHGSDICRLFYFYHRNVVYVVTSGYAKKTQRTSVQEIRRAERLRDEFLNQEEL